MDTSRMKSTLQDLIVRLRDAETGYNEIANGISNTEWIDILRQFAVARHEMHEKLEQHHQELGGQPEVSTSILGEMHKVFIDVKLSVTKVDNEVDAFIDEIERGSERLINDYATAISEVSWTPKILQTLRRQLSDIQEEQRAFISFRERFLEMA